MSTTPTTWRDVADQLTPTQVRRFELLEAPPTGPRDDAHLLEFAREDIRRNRVDAERFGHIPTPDGAVLVTNWFPDDQTARWYREVTTYEFETKPPGEHAVSVSATLNQFADGTIEPWVWVCAESVPMTADQARQFAAAIMNAADKIEALS